MGIDRWDFKRSQNLIHVKTVDLAIQAFLRMSGWRGLTSEICLEKESLNRRICWSSPVTTGEWERWKLHRCSLKLLFRGVW
jgi:hypothetical protein